MNKLSITAIADLHGQLIDTPQCDLLLISGDVCPVYNHDPGFQICWLRTIFCDWLKRQPAKQIVGCWGNHDFVAEVVPTCGGSLLGMWLQDSKYEYEGFNIWGSAWTPVFFDWAFNLPEEELEKKWAAIPNDTDILLLHGPPRGYGDLINGEHVGSPSLTKRIEEVKPKLVVCGHIHPGAGVYQLGPTTIINAALLDDRYQMVRKPFQWTIEDNSRIFQKNNAKASGPDDNSSN